ncbi:restriction endonuclease subunit S [Streptomyces sp. A3M-1-3]|uniref:restriction endonuclease subunit S n=1 Tax=Streptomyces sp. A3M-1-3 TaxID=2962044 RepID=UPI0020B778A4|nr:restriction endonuclease subunit S [Streptomyces sp. A3M-1-3]MCP3819977.1 restriction endonuclease subunit S [Streptomyces sp. A3M-1-3]
MQAEEEIRWVPVRELGEVRMGKQLSPDSRAAVQQFPYLRVANVFDGRIDYSDVKTMGFTETERATYSLRRGDILLNEGQSLELVGRSAIYEGPESAFCFQNTLVRFRAGQEVLPEYAQVVFSRWLATGVFASIAKKTTSIAHLGGERFAALGFPLRTLAHQRRVVDLLDAVTGMERAIEESIAKALTIRDALMGKLLGDLHWDSILADALNGPIRNGFSPVESQTWTGVQMLGLGCLTHSGFSPRQLKNAPASLTVSHPAVLVDGDLLMSRANTRELVGLAGIYRDIGNPCIYPDLMMRLRTSEACLPEFLEAVIRSPRARRGIMALAQGTSESMVKISARAAMGLAVPLPDMAEQKQFLAVLASAGERVDAEVTELAKLRKLKQGLADDLLTGNVEVDDLA